jgi:uncharacterized protein (DUF4213/DUF364 family)
MLLDEVCDQLLPVAAGHSIADVRVGLGYTGVQLDDGRCGLAYTFRQGTGAGCCVLKEAGSLSGRSASELAERAHSQDLIIAALGLATLNALIKPALPSAGDVLDLLSVDKTETVGMVGYFGPLVDPLKRRAKVLHTFEQHENMGPEVLPEGAAERLLPQCQVVIVSATALLNRTLDAILDCCRGAREVAILGPSTPLLPSVFASRGVTILSGIEVTDSRQALRIISEGGGTRQLGNTIRKVSLRVKC